MVYSSSGISGLMPWNILIPAVCLLIVSLPVRVDARQSLFTDPDTEFTQNSEVYEVKRQRWAQPVNRYRFGPYRISKTRSGIESSTSVSSGLFKKSDRQRMSRRDRVEFRRDNDSRLRLTTNFSSEYHTIDRSFNIGAITIETGDYEVRKSIIDTRTEIRTDNDDEPAWTLIIHHPHIILGDNRYEADVTAEFSGTLTGGRYNFDIELVSDYPEDDPDFRAVTRGFLFNVNDSPVAAVQVQPTGSRRVWLLNELDEEVKFILAAASSVILNYHY